MRSQKSKWPIRSLLGVTFALGGCTVGPDYKQPQVTTPDAWHMATLANTAGESEAPIQSWWELFDDPVLNSLIEEARESNLDLQSALASVREARARLAYVGGQNLPDINAFDKVSSTKLSDNGALSQVKPADGFHSQGMMVFGLDAAWEIDVFGRIRREVQAESARFDASIETYRDVLVSLYAEVALAYIEVRSNQAHIANAESNIKVQTQSLDLTEERFKDGLTSQLDIEQAKLNLYTTQAAIPQFRIYLNQAYNRLAVLCGKDAGTMQAQLEAAPLPVPHMNISAGVPADLLRQRPDIRMAERDVAASSAMIGVATADLYPRFALKGAIGMESRSVSTLFDSSSVVWTLAAPVHWNIFSGGRVRDNIEIHKEKYEKTVLEYQQAVLEALEEVENAMVGINEQKSRYDHLKLAEEATQSAVELVTIQYESGLTDFDNVLNMQRALYEQQDRLVNSQSDGLKSIIALYKAVGGGWNPEVPTNEEEQPVADDSSAS